VRLIRRVESGELRVDCFPGLVVWPEPVVRVVVVAKGAAPVADGRERAGAEAT